MSGRTATQIVGIGVTPPPPPGVERPGVGRARRGDRPRRPAVRRLTGRWPNDLPTGLAAAPVLEGSPVRVRHLAPDAPKDLSHLCDQTLIVGEGGPASPAELILALKPWGPAEPLDPSRAATRSQSRVVLPDEPAPAQTRTRPGATGTTASTPVIRTPAGVERPPVPPAAAAARETEALAQPTVRSTQVPAPPPATASPVTPSVSRAAPAQAGSGNGDRGTPPADARRTPDVLLPWTDGWSTAERRRVDEDAGFGPFPLVTRRRRRAARSPGWS